MQALIGALVGAILYAFVLQPRRLQPSQTYPTATDCLWVFGIILPFWIFVPQQIMNVMGIHNQIFRFSIAAITPTLSMFRATQALFGFAPLSDSIGSYAFQYGSPLLIKAHKGQWQRATLQSTIRQLVQFGTMLLVTGVFQSCFYCFDSFPSFHIPRPEQYYITFTLEQSKDNLLFGFLILFYLTGFCDGLAFLTMLLTGYETHPVMLNPLFGSSSPSDFWGRRWNRLIHDCLKQGVYKPVRSLGGSHLVGALGAFVASGLFHEWLLVEAFPTTTPMHGPTLFFFTWQVCLLVLEKQVGHWKIFATLQRSLPRPVLSLMVVMLALPIGHFFLDCYVHSAFFEHGSLLLPIVRPVGGW